MVYIGIKATSQVEPNQYAEHFARNVSALECNPTYFQVACHHSLPHCGTSGSRRGKSKAKSQRNPIPACPTKARSVAPRPLKLKY